MCMFFLLFCVLFVCGAWLWSTVVISNVFLKVPRLSQIFDAPRKLSLLLIHVNDKTCTTTFRTTATIVNI